MMLQKNLSSDFCDETIFLDISVKMLKSVVLVVLLEPTRIVSFMKFGKQIYIIYITQFDNFLKVL